MKMKIYTSRRITLHHVVLRRAAPRYVTLHYVTFVTSRYVMVQPICDT